ncbi:MAG: efflux RND transporter permease subunit [Acidaminococcaceae bacterium]|nr:efflux RND transporter permease subunit [Acidaminococcaceae bacterium]
MIGTFIRRPVFTTMFVLLLVVFGIRFYPELGLDLNPDVELPIVSVRVSYSGASPEEMETLVAKPIENRVSQVAGIKNISTTVLEGYSETVLEFNISVDPLQKSSEVREKIAGIRRRLPDDIDEPTVQTVDLGSRPILVYTFASEGRSRSEVRQLVEDTVKDELQMVDGVAEVGVYGAGSRAVRVLVDPEKLSQYGISMQALRSRINGENYNTPGGKAKNTAGEITVRTVGKYTDIDAIKNVVVSGSAGRYVLVSDVAQVVDGWEEEESYGLAEGKPSVLVFVRKQSKTNTVDVTENVAAKMEELKETSLPSDISVHVIRDQSSYIRENVADVWNAILFGGLLALIITYMFLRNFRATIIGGLCIPTSIVATFFMMKLLGFTLNNMSLMAMSLAVGILIDDAIVVIENIYRHIEMGKTPFQAAKEATEELTLAILATSFALMAVFVPIGSMGELIGQFFKEFGLTVAFAIAFSTVVAFSLTPMVSAYWLVPKNDALDRKERLKFLQTVLDKFEQSFQTVSELYSNIMGFVLTHPKKIIMIGVISLGVNILLLPFVGKEFQPTYDSGEFTVNFKAPVGTSLQKTIALADPLQQYISDLPEVSIAAVSIGAGRNPVNQGSIEVRLKDVSERSRSMQQVMDELRGKFRDVEGLRVSVVSNQGGGRGDSRSVQVGLRGSDMKMLKEYAAALAEELRNVQGATDVDISDAEEQPEITVKLDPYRAAEAGLDATSVGEMVKLAFMGRNTANTYTIGDDSYNIILQLPDENRRDINDVMNLRVSSPSGKYYRLGDIATVKLTAGPTRIERQDKQRQVVVYANTAGISPGDLIEKIKTELMPKLNMQPGYSYKMIGQAQDMEKSFAEIAKAIVLAVIIVYMVLASQFESFLQPFIIMASLPFAVIGALLGLLVAGQTINILSMVGFIMLLGLVTKNAILLIDYANQKRAAGESVRQAVLEACSMRLRPIFMTTLSTILGMLPIALGWGAGAELRQSMGVVLVGGLITSTALTLLVVPALYILTEGRNERLHEESAGGNKL